MGIFDGFKNPFSSTLAPEEQTITLQPNVSVEGLNNIYAQAPEQPLWQQLHNVPAHALFVNAVSAPQRGSTKQATRITPVTSSELFTIALQALRNDDKLSEVMDKVHEQIGAENPTITSLDTPLETLISLWQTRFGNKWVDFTILKTTLIDPEWYATFHRLANSGRLEFAQPFSPSFVRPNTVCRLYV
ncbi:MAG TPA: hypothetical protein PLQ34_07710 [Ferrovaceae bacterium]|nr:hypothetical protein [Ferrovaceae bacterium]